MFVTNVTTHAGAPVLLGLTEQDSLTIAIRVSAFSYHVYTRPPGRAAHSENSAAQWASQALKAHSHRLVQKRLLCGGDTVWLARSSFSSDKDANAFGRKMERMGVSVYHHRVSPENAFMARTGVRCFTWIDIGENAHAKRPCVTRCDVEVGVHFSVVKTVVDDPPPPPVLRACAFDMETDGLDHTVHEIRMISTLTTDHNPILFSRWPIDTDEGYDVRVYPAESDLIQAFCNHVVAMNPIFLTGWNVYGFDIPFLWERAKINKIESVSFSAMSWMKRTPKPTRKTMASSAFGHNDVFDDDLQGIICLDGYLIARKSLQLESYSLATMATRIGKAKGDVSYADMVQAFTTEDPLLLRDVADYCVTDTVLVPAILESIEQPTNTMAMATLTCCTPSQVLKRGMSSLIFHLILAEATDRDIVINPPPKFKDESTGYEGALVLDPKKGFYADPVSCLDFASLYPSLMRGYNLCVTTLITDVSKAPEGATHVDVGDGRVVAFDTAGDEAVMPGILRVLLEERKTVRCKMKDLGKKTDAYRLANAKQLALKVCANSLYGFFGFQHSQIYVKDLAASVTALGRQSIQRVVQFVEGEGYTVVYGDTDSVFIQIPGSPENARTTATAIAERASSMFPAPMALEYEKTFITSVFMNKKRYGGLLLEDNEVMTKGLSINRRDFCTFVQNTIRDSLHTLLDPAQGPRGMVRAVESHFERLLEGHVAQTELTTSKELRKNFHDSSSIIALLRRNVADGCNIWRGLAVTPAFTRPFSNLTAPEVLERVTKSPETILKPLLGNTYASFPPVAVLARRMITENPETAPKLGDRVSFFVGRGRGASVAERIVAAGTLGVEPDHVYYVEQALDQVADLFKSCGMEREFGDIRETFMRKASLAKNRQHSILNFFQKKALC